MEPNKVTRKDIKLAKRIQKIRKKFGLTQEQLAYKTSLSVTFIGLLESGKRKPSIKTLQKIASALHVKSEF